MVLSHSGRPLPLPPAGLRFMGEDDERLIRVGDELAGLLVAHGLTASSTVLDVGSGYGRLALGILHATDHRGPYLGFDILARQIEWCRTAISPGFPAMEFRHLDIRNDRYNPKGKVQAGDVSFPTRSGGTDVAALFSVFTHMYRHDIERYLAEIHRVLKPGAVAVTTWLLFDDARLQRATSSEASYPMIHVLDDVTRYSDETDPLRAIAFHEDAVRAMAGSARLEVEVIEHGTWTGEAGREFQDLVVLRRAASDQTIDPEPTWPRPATKATVAGDTLLALSRRVLRRGRRLVGRAARSVRRRRPEG